MTGDDGGNDGGNEGGNDQQCRYQGLLIKLNPAQ